MTSVTVFPVLAPKPSSFMNIWLEPTTVPLTEKLKKLTGNARLQLLKQGWAPTDYWDRQVLHLQEAQIFKREILMFSGKYICWYARTLIPQSCYSIEPAFFNRLQTGPLTPLVFNEPVVQKTACFIYPVDENCQEFYWYSGDKSAYLWCKLSQFEFKKSKNFYLIEIFLPDLLRFEE